MAPDDPLHALLARVVAQRSPAQLLQRSVFDDLVAAAAERLDKATSGISSWAVDAARDGPALATIRAQIRSGNRDENDLTNTVFYYVHQELPWGMKLEPEKNPAHAPLRDDWLRLRAAVVRPELKRTPGASVPPPTSQDSNPSAPEPQAPVPDPQAPAPDPDPPAATATSRDFLATHGHLLRKLDVKDDDELLFLLDIVFENQRKGKGTDNRVEYDNYNWERPKPMPLTHRLFVRRHPGVDPLTQLVSAKDKTFAATIDSWDATVGGPDGWAKYGLSPELWKEIKSIREEIYRFMRIVLPRMEAPGKLRTGASYGERVVHEAHKYLGIRYVNGGRWMGKDKLAWDPWAEVGTELDCSSFVRLVYRDVGLEFTGGPKNAGSDAITLCRSTNVSEVTNASDLQPGDLLCRRKHIGIFVGYKTVGDKQVGEVIQAPSSGNVVSKSPFSADKWEGFQRFNWP